MKRLFLALMIFAIAFTACTKDRVDAPAQKTEFKTVFVRIATTENTGKVIYSNVAAVKIEVKK